MSDMTHLLNGLTTKTYFKHDHAPPGEHYNSTWRTIPGVYSRDGLHPNGGIKKGGGKKGKVKEGQKAKQPRAKTAKTLTSHASSSGPAPAPTYRIVHPLMEEFSTPAVGGSGPLDDPPSAGSVGLAAALQASASSPVGPLPAPEGSAQSARPAAGPQEISTAGTTGRGKSVTRQPKKMNLETVKFHSLGHYPSTVRFRGPTDLYSTEWGESFHGSPKSWLKSMSKRFVWKELSMHKRKRVRLKKVKYRLLTKGRSAKSQELREQRLASRNPDIHHYIGTSKTSPVYLSQFSQGGNLSTDVSCLSFVRNLKMHLLPRFLQATDPNIDNNTTREAMEYLDWSRIVLKDDRMYTHRIMRIKYTMYDARRDEDIIHLDTQQCNIMLLNPAYTYGSSIHPYKYGKVIGILHAEVGYVGDIGRQGTEYPYYPMEFLWVRWYAALSPAADFALDQAELLPIDAPEAHNIVNPLEVLRACHMVPSFSDGPRFEDGKGSLSLQTTFVDRDMFMRYEWGLAVGHTYAHKDATAANMEVRRTHAPPQGSLAPRLEPRPSPGEMTSAAGEGAGCVDVEGDEQVDREITDGNVDEEAGGAEGGLDVEGQVCFDEDEGGDEDEDEDAEGSTDEDEGRDGYADDSEAEKEYLLFGTCDL